MAALNPHDFPERYIPLHAWLARRFGGRTYKLSIDGGYSCPNRDGTVARGGCTFCAQGSRALTWAPPKATITQQIEHNIGSRVARGKREHTWVAYFQAFTSTYAPVELLRAQWQEALVHPSISGLAVSTRSDCLPDEVIALLADFAARVPLWVEVGLQTAHDRTLERINRADTAESFATSVRRLADAGIETVGHLIFGLPGETPEMMMQSVDFVAALPLSGIKIHPLHIVRGTPMAAAYAEGRMQPPEMADYVEWACEALRRIPPDWAIHRLTGEGAGRLHIAPDWAVQKLKLLHAIRERMRQLDVYQGDLFEAAESSIALRSASPIPSR